ncbi:MAG: large conductance mechanosensitive channel protein MscL [Clostridia bacterium]|nr:large conductance mechanosensitive channel protein MscL [Clostridia bacterium]
MFKKLIKEFKDFALKGNVIDLAVGVIIGGAFGKVVTAVIDIFLQPLLDSLPKMEGGGTGFAGSLLAFLGVLVEFILTALVLFAIIKAVNAAKKMTKKPEAPAAPTTRDCPFCCSSVSIKATRCPHCTSVLPEYKP